MAKLLVDQYTDAIHRVAEQEIWIQQCGGNVRGYIAKYGEVDNPNRSGDGGRAIYVADMAELRKRQLVLKSVRTKIARKIGRQVGVGLKESEAALKNFFNRFED